MSYFPQKWPALFALALLVSIVGAWYNLVSKNVPDPYLDEVFHVPQAQRYCNNDYTWDPKITTPPGLYLLSLLVNSTFGYCSTSSLRALNVGAICVLFLVAYDTLRVLNRRLLHRGKNGDVDTERLQNTADDPQLLLDAHAALNISLFPPLFFFSSLYYTDVISTLVVLLSYNLFLRNKKGQSKICQGIISVFIGAVALSFRQTNIFWVAVFPAGLALVETLKNANEFLETTNKRSVKADDAMSIVKRSWSGGHVYDLSIQDAGLADCVLFPISIALAALGKPIVVLKAVLPYIVLLGLFASFVVWNGGVVLGDKSNHVATIHVPQMLYLWPYIVFFSIPLTFVSLVRPVLHLFPESPLKTFLQNNLAGSSGISAPAIISTCLFTIAGLGAVHFNTIVHPFTLADNRHYVFYVFRILRRHSALKYLAVPFYYICAWMAVVTLGSTSEHTVKVAQEPKDAYPVDDETERQPCQLSFVIVWLITTALSLITAPLVEPRYFIIPWIIWRLHVPNIGASLSPNRSRGKGTYDLRLFLETAWLLTVNATIAYNFLYRGFSWPNEPGKVQRFLW
ncbi:glycosyltransferase family 59 protein [Pleomassaria siparia CBS 279.74]|uniref:Dol-P-Glc:Glc(2)Man(9)GlcNAc(2)-PP-Dol alpha-1,2-glucosyltransferase n=1 Tax=Pleomassaria siparia CBS 279.74 TaxID=1314801 RepID=A0A6G1K8W8_9PLEO|nr:glycosyltransferase family 59 protein [Pleomassaria siparia CBS 279.74]